MTIKEKLQEDLDAAKAKVTELETALANLPAEVENVAEEAWENIKQFFKNLV